MFSNTLIENYLNLRAVTAQWAKAYSTCQGEQAEVPVFKDADDILGSLVRGREL